mmetsp:Transcript_39851/g.96164  ORF Transcript_39851/g.96164 Transcript_39851/m.96164 type:complete len:450 (-) Transcript_39851:62-1411(-)
MKSVHDVDNNVTIVKSHRRRRRATWMLSPAAVFVFVAAVTTMVTIVTKTGNHNDGVNVAAVVWAWAWTPLQSLHSLRPPSQRSASSKNQRLKMTSVLLQQQQQQQQQQQAPIGLTSKTVASPGGGSSGGSGSGISSREEFLKALATISTCSSSLSLLALSYGNPSPCHAAAPSLDAGEAVRRGAANIPGYGPTDIFYPLSLKGSWTMTRQVELYSSSSSSSPSSSPSRTFTLTYPYRFIQSIENDAVVADRGFNQASLEQAILDLTAATSKTKTSSDNSAPGPATATSQSQSLNQQQSGSTVQYEWAVNNPNDLRIRLPNGSFKEIKVTKRATERNRQPSSDSNGNGSGGGETLETITSSEFQRITQEEQSRANGNGNGGGGSGGGGGIPIASVSARRVVSKYKISADNQVEGLEIVYDMGGADPLSVQPGVKSSQPIILSKSRIVLTR